MLGAELSAEDHQGQQGGHHCGQGPQEGGGRGGGEDNGHVGGDVAPGDAQAGQEPVLHRAGLQSLPDALVKEQGQEEKGDEIPGRQQGVQGNGLVGGLGDGVAEAVEDALQEDEPAGQPPKGDALFRGQVDILF